MHPLERLSHGTQLKVTKFILQESGTYNPVYSRPYTSRISPYDLDCIANRVSDTRAGNITGVLLAGAASNILSPSVKPANVLPVINGWDTRRIRFMLELSTITSTGAEWLYVYQGYTSHLGVTQQGAVDPTMEFIINSFMKITRVREHTYSGVGVTDIVTESAQVINGRFQSVTGVNFLIRPTDIFSSIQYNHINTAYRYTDPDDSIIDTRLRLGITPKRSKRANALPSSYLASVLDSYILASAFNDYGQRNEDIYDKAKQRCYERSLTDNPLLHRLEGIQGRPDANSFVLGDLMAIDPGAYAVMRYAALGDTAIRQLPHQGQTQYWHGTDRETVISSVLANAIPALMMEVMIQKMVFTATNHSIGGHVIIVVEDVMALTTANISTNIDVFKARLEKEVLYDLSYGNQDLYGIKVSSDVFGDTYIDVSINNGPSIRYTVPSFCDSIMTPVVTSSRNNLEEITNDMEQIMNHVRDANSHVTIPNQYTYVE